MTTLTIYNLHNKESIPIVLTNMGRWSSFKMGLAIASVYGDYTTDSSIPEYDVVVRTEDYGPVLGIRFSGIEPNNELVLNGN